MDTILQDALVAIAKEQDPKRKLTMYAEIMHRCQAVDEAQFSRYFRPMMRLAKQLGDQGMQANALRFRGLNHLHHADLKKASRDLSFAARLFKEANVRDYDSDIYRTLALISEQRGDFSNALRQFHIALRLAEETNSHLMLMTVCLSLGTFYINHLSDYKKALQYFQRSYKVARTHERWQSYTAACMYIAESYLFLEKPALAKKFLDEGFKVAREKQQQLSLIYLKATYARYLKQASNYKEAAAVLEEVIEEASQRNATIIVATEAINLAECYLRLRKWKRMNELIALHETITKKNTSYINYNGSRRLKFEIAKKKKNYGVAIAILEEMLKRQEDEFKNDWQQKMEILELSFSMERYKIDKEVAERLAQMRMDFLSNVSHEIRSPMNAVLGLTSILLRKNAANENAEYLQTIKSSAEHLLHVINDIVDLSRIDAGKLSIDPTRMNLRETLSSVYHGAQLKLAEKGLKWHLRIDNKAPEWIFCDAARLTQILVNIIHNAIKFTQKGSISVDVSSRSLKSARKAILSFTITDTGIGMTAEQCKNLFKRYEQAESGTFGKFGGSGLGLNISKQLVELMGGSIHVESELKKGTTFSFSIPIKLESAAKSQKVTSHTSGLAAKRFMVVEDDETDMTVMLDALLTGISEELNILQAYSGQKALQILESTAQSTSGQNNLSSLPVDIVLTDLRMPHMNGFQLAKEIKRLYPSVIVVAVTSMLVTLDEDQLRAEGIDALVTKPYRNEKLLKTVSELLSK